MRKTLQDMFSHSRSWEKIKLYSALSKLMGTGSEAYWSAPGGFDAGSRKRKIAAERILTEQGALLLLKHVELVKAHEEIQ